MSIGQPGTCSERKQSKAPHSTFVSLVFFITEVNLTFVSEACSLCKLENSYCLVDCWWFLLVIWQRGSSEICVPCGRGFPSEKLRETAASRSHNIQKGNSGSAQLLLLFPHYHFPSRGAPKATSEASSAAQLLPSSQAWPGGAALHQGLPLGFLSLLGKVGVLLCPSPLATVGMKAGNPFERSSQELPSCCKEQGPQLCY